MPDDQLSAARDFVQLVALRPRPQRGTRAPRRRWLAATLRLVLLVLLPTGLAAWYFLYAAADRFVAEARFTIVKPSSPVRGAGASVSFEEGGKGIGSDDGYIVRDYLRSRDAMQLLLEKADLLGVVAKAAGDPLWEFPGPGGVRTNERLFEHVQSMVDVDYATSSGITTLRVQAFTAADAKRIAEVLLDGSEALVNEMTRRARGDALRVAEADLARARAEAEAAEDALTAFRNRWSVVDPTSASDSVLVTIGTLSLRLVEAYAVLDVTTQNQPKSPQIGPLRTRIRALETQIERERAKLASGGASLAPQIAEYERLLMQRNFAARSYISAMSVAETVRLEAERQQAYVSRVVLPQLSDDPTYPYRLVWPSVVFACGMAAFALTRGGKTA